MAVPLRASSPSAKLLLLPALLCPASPAAADLALAEDGRAQCVIVAADRATAHEKLAARDLRDTLRQITGARVEITDSATSGVNILVGRPDRVSQLLPDVDWAALGTDGVVIKTVDSHLILTGGRPRGTLNAVYTFLQDVVGCRWWAPDASHIPRRPTLTIPALDILYRPQFEFRYVSSEGAGRDKALARRLRNNGLDTKFDPDGESILRYVLPHHEHFIEHPDWYMYWPPEMPAGDPRQKYTFAFGLEEGLKEDPARYEIARTHHRLPFQPCLTSAGALAAATRGALARLETEYPNMAHHPPALLWVVQQDGGWMCRCDGCRAVREAEGSDSANWVNFANHIAETVEAKYPDVLVGIHAYLHTIKPPRTVRPRHNLLIYVASLDRDHKLSFGEQSHGEYVRQWCKIARRVWVWDYDANFRNYIAPHPNHLATARSIKFCADAGARGMRIQGGHGKLCDLVHMRNWVSCQMMWDASQDADALRKEFAAGYYGAAGPLVLRYVHLLDTIIHRDNTFLSCFADSTKNWLALEDLNALTRIVTKAEAVTAHDAVLAARVNVLRFSVDAVWLQRYHELKAAAEERGIAFLGPDDPRVALGRFEAIQNNVGHYAERREFPEFVAKLKAIHRETN